MSGGGGGGSNLWQSTLKEKTYKAQLLAAANLHGAIIHCSHGRELNLTEKR